MLRIKNLNGKPSGNYIIFGMLTQMKDGSFYLEDPDSHIRLVITEKVILLM